jgi:anti-anti-sigma factor
MEMSAHEAGGWTTFTVTGRLDASSAATAEAALSSAVAGGALRLVLDLAGLDYISSAGLRVLLATAKKVARQDGALVLCQLQSGVREVLAISGLLSVFTVTDTLAEAQCGSSG